MNCQYELSPLSDLFYWRLPNIEYLSKQLLLDVDVLLGLYFTEMTEFVNIFYGMLTVMTPLAKYYYYG